MICVAQQWNRSLSIDSEVGWRFVKYLNMDYRFLYTRILFRDFMIILIVNDRLRTLDASGFKLKIITLTDLGLAGYPARPIFITASISLADSVTGYNEKSIGLGSGKPSSV